MQVRLAVLDMPGYGFASRDEWGKEIVTYLQRRKQLRRAFVLIDALHGIKSADEQMVELLRSEGISYQVIVSKADRLIESSRGASNTRLQTFFELVRSEIVQPDTGKGVEGLGEILAVGNLGDDKKNVKVREQDMLGIDRVRWAVLVAAGLEEWATKRLNKKKRTDFSEAEPSMRDKENMVPGISEDHSLNDREQTSSTPVQTDDSSSPLSSFTSMNEENPPNSTPSLITEYHRVSALAKLDSRLTPPTKKVKHHKESMPVPARLASFHFGGLAELEAHLPSKSKHKKFQSSKRDRRAGSSKTKTPTKMSEPLKKRLTSQRERPGSKMESKRAAGPMYADYRERRHPFPDRERALRDRSHNPAPSIPSPVMKYASTPSPRMINGKGVGGMADLLATSSSSSNNKIGGGRGRGRGRGRSRADEVDGREKAKNKNSKERAEKKRRQPARGKFKAAAKAKALARPDNKGW